MQLWFSEPERQRLVEGTVAAGRLPAGRGDFLLLTDANVSASKANLGLVRRAEYHLWPQGDGSVRAHLRVELRNEAPAGPLNPSYNGYLRVYVPASAHVLERHRGQRDEAAADGPYRVLSRRVTVPPLERRTLHFDYVLPASVAPEGRYDLTWMRQPGTPRDSFQVVIAGRPVEGEPGGRAVRVSYRLASNPVARWLRATVLR